MKLAVFGASGRMGLALINAISLNEKTTLSGALDSSTSDKIGEDSGIVAGLTANNIPISADVDTVLDQVDGIIDFTIPQATLSLAQKTAQRGLVHIIGTTGLDDTQEAELHKAAEKAIIVKSGNMSLGVNLLSALVKKVASSLDEAFDIEIVEMHHKHKVDAPSGTALLLGEAAAQGREIKLSDRSVMSREGYTGARKEGDIGFATLRGGSVVGDHSVIFAGEFERIELTHLAQDRGIFANGAVKAALWAQNKQPGYYTMLDVLGIQD